VSIAPCRDHDRHRTSDDLDREEKEERAARPVLKSRTGASIRGEDATSGGELERKGDRPQRPAAGLWIADECRRSAVGSHATPATSRRCRTGAARPIATAESVVGLWWRRDETRGRVRTKKRGVVLARSLVRSLAQPILWSDPLQALAQCTPGVARLQGLETRFLPHEVTRGSVENSTGSGPSNHGSARLPPRREVAVPCPCNCTCPVAGDSYQPATGTVSRASGSRGSGS